MSEVFNADVLDAINRALSAENVVTREGEEPVYCNVNNETREIEIPGEITIFGVEHDENAVRVFFKCPKIIGDNVDIDITRSMVYIIYINAGGEKDQYIVTDVNETEDGNVTFSWLINRKPAKYQGITQFGIRVIKSKTGGEIENEWNTTVANANILNGVETEDIELSGDNIDVVNQLLDLTKQEIELKKQNSIEEIEQKGQETLETIPSDYTTAAQNALSAKNEVEDIRVGFDGTTYDSAGEAVREQTRNIVNGNTINYKAISAGKTDFASSDIYQYIDPQKYVSGYYYDNGIITQHDDYKYYPELLLPAGKYYFYGDSTFCYLQASGEELENLKSSDYCVYDEASIYKCTISCNKNFKLYLSSLKRDDVRETQFIVSTGNFSIDKVMEFRNPGYYGSKKIFDIDLSALANSIDTMNDTINDFDKSLGHQYLNDDTSLKNTTWNESLKPYTHESQTEYIAYQPVILRKGKYYTLNLSTVFTFIVDSTGTHSANNYDQYNADTGELQVDDPMVTVYMTIYVSGGVAEKMYGLISNRPISLTPHKYGYFEPSVLELKNDIKDLSNNINKVFYVGSEREYKTLKSVIEEAVKYRESTVYLDPETFDLVEEFGKEYLDSYNGGDDGVTMIGIFLSNDIHLIGSGQTKIVFNYTGENEHIHELFSPFNFMAGNGGFTLENIHIESRNCRYSVHDEGGGNEIPYKNVYKACTFLHDSSECSWGAHQAVGGGLGTNSYILVEDCYMESIGCEDTLSYHNPVRLDKQTKSLIVVKNSYLSGTTLCANYGRSNEKSRMMVSGCSLSKEPKLEKVITEDRFDNMELIAWGNTIRNE